MNRTKIEVITYICILYCQSNSYFYFLSNLDGFPDILNYIKRNGGVGTAKNAKSSRLTSWQYDINVSKQTTLLDGVDVETPKWRVSMEGLIDRVHENMNPSLM